MEKQFKELYSGDMARYGGEIEWKWKVFHYCFRRVQTSSNRLVKLFFRIPFSLIRRSVGIEMSSEMDVGPGLCLGHPYNITLNAAAKMGANVNIHKGATVGQENRGKRKGVPTIGDRVYIGINATVVGNIKIGNDIMIAANSFVNCDVPDHSVVIGNPCVIKHRDHATEMYVVNTVGPDFEEIKL